MQWIALTPPYPPQLFLWFAVAIMRYQEELQTESWSPQSYLLLSWQFNAIPAVDAWTCYL